MTKSTSKNEIGVDIEGQPFLHRTYGINKSYCPISFRTIMNSKKMMLNKSKSDLKDSKERFNSLKKAMNVNDVSTKLHAYYEYKERNLSENKK